MSRDMRKPDSYHDSNQMHPGPISNGRPEVMDFSDKSDTEKVSDPENEPIPSNSGTIIDVNENPTLPVSNHPHGPTTPTDTVTERSDSVGSTNMS